MPNTLMPGITAPELRAKKLDGSIWDLSVSEAPSFTMIIFLPRVSLPCVQKLP